MLLSREGFECETLQDLSGLNRRYPLYAGIMALSMLSLAGVPLTVGFYGKFRDGAHRVDVTDLMRRMVKEDMLRFDGSHLFPPRLAYTVNYKLSDQEAALYGAVKDVVYVPTQGCMNLAASVNVILYDRLAKQLRGKLTEESLHR